MLYAVRRHWFIGFIMKKCHEMAGITYLDGIKYGMHVTNRCDEYCRLFTTEKFLSSQEYSLNQLMLHNMAGMQNFI